MVLGRNARDQRFSSLEDDFADKALSGLRCQFGGHEETTAADKAGA
jgi:6-phosphogluconate dehydrogenase (decarboxylating)